MRNIRAFYQSFSIWSWLIFLSYPLLLLYFKLFDTYHQHFFSAGLTIVLYHFARFFFMLYFMWLLYAVGDEFLSLFAHGKALPITFELVLLSFFTGVGVLHPILFLMGLAGYYDSFIMMLMTLLILTISLPKLDMCIRQFISQKNLIYWPGLCLVLLPALFFLMTKGFYPAGGHDYYNHYFQFYRKVIESGNILPNEIWYQFYYSKGAGLFFLAMLLTDPLAPQLATTVMIFAAAGIIFSLFKSSVHWRLFPWLGASLYLLFFIYTPGPLENLHQGGWGDLEKPHELAAVLMLAIIWISIHMAESFNCRLWGISLLATVSAVVFISPTTAVFAAAYLGLVCSYFLFSKNNSGFIWTFLAILLIGVWFISLAIINYVYTGLPDDQFLLIVWPLIDFDKIKEWGVLFELLMLHYGKISLVANKIPLSFNFLWKMITYLRLDIWGSYFILTLCFAIITWGKWSTSLLKNAALFAFGGFIVLIAFLSIFIGRDQPISFYRYTSFCYAPTLCFCLLFLSVIMRKYVKLAALVILLGCLGAWTMTYQINHGFRHLKYLIKDDTFFMLGKYSLADAYQHQQGWPARLAWGGIYPPIEEICKRFPNVRIWSLHIHSYCMLPNCHLETYSSFRLSRSANVVLFADPKNAMQQLKQEKLNYFFFSNSLEMTDPLPLSPLFSPQHIADYLGIAWTDGDNTLLTWKEQARYPIDSLWLARYKLRLAKSSIMQTFPYHSIKFVLDLAQKKKTLAASDLPWMKG